MKTSNAESPVLPLVGCSVSGKSSLVLPPKRFDQRDMVSGFHAFTSIHAQGGASRCGAMTMSHVHSMLDRSSFVFVMKLMAFFPLLR